MTEQRAVFIDFDGTLADHGIIPPEHVEAIAQARANGHLIFLCTGRPLGMVLPEVEELFDGMVLSGGAYVKHGGEVLLDEEMSEDLARRALDMLDAEGVGYVVESSSSLHVPAALINEYTAYIHGAQEKHGNAAPGSIGNGPIDIIKDLTPLPESGTPRITKIAVFGARRPIADIAKDISPELNALPNSLDADDLASGEIHLTRIDKADGVQFAADHLGLPISATVGIGDGANDEKMLRLAGVGVGIEGAPQFVLDAADWTVAGPWGLGVREAFQRLQLI